MNWKLKLKALLHDPPHKQWVMFSEEGHQIKPVKAIHQRDKHQWHQIVAEHFLNYILANECVADEQITRADTLASALSRTIVSPQMEKDLKDKFERDSVVRLEEAKFIDIFSLKETILDLPVHEDVEEIFQKLSKVTFKNPEDRAKFFFFLLWRFYPELFPWIKSHPADSRAPNHSIYDHLVQTSAIVSALPEPAFLLYTIGPVQSFISKAKKTQDLWAGSYMLSWLIWESMKPVIEQLGPDTIVFPNLFGQPLMDKWLKKLEFGGQTFEEILNALSLQPLFNDAEDNLTIANLPNRFLAIVNYQGGDKKIAKECEQRCKSSLAELAKKTAEKLCDKTNTHELMNSIRNQIFIHLENYFRVYWAILPWSNMGEVNDLSPIFNDYKKLVGETELYEIIRLITEFSYYRPTNVGSAYSLLLELIEKLLGARKSSKDFNPIYEEGDKCTLCGEFNQLWLQDSGPEWINPQKRKQNSNLWNSVFPFVKEGERLCGVCLTKRLFPEIIKDELALTAKVKFPSTAEMASIGEKRKMSSEVKERFKKTFEKFETTLKSKNSGKSLPETESVPAIKDFDIDGQFLMKNSYREDYFKKEYSLDVKEEDFKEILQFLQENKINPLAYYAILQMDGDNMGRWLKGEFNPEIKRLIHPKATNALLAYATEEEKERLYNILCSSHPNSPSLHQAFSRRLSEFALEHVRRLVEEKYYGRLVYAGGDDILALLPIEGALGCAYDLQRSFQEVISPKATMSAGILIVHYKYPLYLALKEVADTEKMAKNYFEKDAFCLRILTHSGHIRQTGGKWSLIPFIEELICKFKNRKISSRFPYQFLETIERLLLPERREDRRRIKPSDEIFEVIKTELQRIYDRKIKEESEKEFLEKILKCYLNYEFSYDDFANIFISAKFMADEMRAL
jgi:CRISPR-associated protein Cmr2